MAIGMAAAALGGSLISSAFGLFGARKQNKSARAEAATNREFQERMSNTAYRRAATDMQAAGLNRILAAKQGGATSPSGNQAPIVNTLAEAANSARAIATQIAQLKNTQAQTRNTDANTDFKKQELEILQTTGKSPVGDVINTGVTSAKSLWKVSKQHLSEPAWAAKARKKRLDAWKKHKIPTSGKGRRKMVSDWWNQ